MSERIPCINPRCRRTAPKEKHEGDNEIICGKCFRTLPESVRKEHRGYWREIRKWEKRITRTSDEMKIARMRDIISKLCWRLGRHWDREIKPRMIAPEKPEGLETFLEEIGMNDS